jgi:CAAX protease family protein
MSADENSSLPGEPAAPSEPGPHTPEHPPSGVPEPAIGAPEPMPLQSSSKWIPQENFNVPWGWLDVALIVPIVIALMFLLALVIVGAEVVILHRPASYIRAHLSFMLISAQIVTEIALLGYLGLQVRQRSRLPFWPTIGWRPLRPQTSRLGMCAGLILGGIALSFLVAGASAAFPPPHPLPIERILATRSLTILFMATAVFVAPVVEETIFRGYLFPVAARSFGVAGGIVFTGAVFGLLHGSQLWGGWWQIGLLVIVGIIFTYVRAATRTVVSSFLLHISYNSLQVIALLYAMYGPRHMLGLH